jgi:hypothetical protein
MNKILSPLFLAAVVLSLSGCFINMDTTTKINDDGSGFRITTLTADGASEKVEVLKDYDLPAGGEWKLDQYVKDTPPHHVYEVKRAFKDMNKLAPDYVRKGAKPGNASANKFALKITRGILFTTYEYEETYRDCTDSGKMKKFCEGWYGHAIDTASAEVTRAFPKAVKEEKARAMLEARFRPFLDFILAGLLSDGRRMFSDNNSDVQAKSAEYEKKYSAEDFSAFFTDYIVSVDKAADRKAVEEKLMAVHASIDKQLSDYGTALGDSNYDDAFGVYGWPILMGYTFDVSVVMPGRIIAANTKDIKPNSAKWEFTSDDFFLSEYKLHARSRKLNFAGIGVIAVIALAAVFVSYKRERRNKRKKPLSQ